MLRCLSEPCIPPGSYRALCPAGSLRGTSLLLDPQSGIYVISLTQGADYGAAYEKLTTTTTGIVGPGSCKRLDKTITWLVEVNIALKS